MPDIFDVGNVYVSQSALAPYLQQLTQWNLWQSNMAAM